jgi:hypothetical protein
MRPHTIKPPPHWVINLIIRTPPSASRAAIRAARVALGQWIRGLPRADRPGARGYIMQAGYPVLLPHERIKGGR